MTPPPWLQTLVARRSTSLYSRLFRFCFRCDKVQWRRHQHGPSDAEAVITRHLESRFRDNDWRNV